MKKLIISAFAVAFAAFAQAASINWTFSNVYGPETQTLATKGSYTAMLFITENTTDVSSYAVTTLSSVKEMIAAENWTGVANAASASKGLSGNGSMIGATGLSTAFSSGSLSAFVVVFDTATALDLTTANNYYVLNDGATQTASFTSSSGTKTLAYGTQAANSQLAIDSSSAAWQSIPEPTSGLLLLLGMGALALRRKQA